MRPPRPFHRTAALAAGIVMIGLHAGLANAANADNAQGDRRNVGEPALPTSICAELKPKPAMDDAPAAGGDRQRIQDALTGCRPGGAVRLDADADGNRFVSGPLSIPSGVTLWIDRGATLAASTDATAYDRGKGTCGTLARQGGGCLPFISISNADNAAIVGDGVIDGQGDRPIKGGTETWWQLARRAQSEDLNQNAPRLIQVNGGHDLTLYRITLHDAPNFHIFLNGIKGATIWGIRIDTPATARNTDGIDPAAATDVTIAHSFIRTGDDNIAIKAGTGGPTAHISIIDNHFYSGHGMSIGSEIQSGVSDILVRDMTLDGTTNGLRIKSDRSRGGIVENVVFDNVCMRGNKAPLVLDTAYDRKAKGDLIPDYRSITMRNVEGSGGPLVVRGLDTAYPVHLLLDNVDFGDDAQWQQSNAEITTGNGGATPGIGSGEPQAARGIGCAGRWAPFPEPSTPAGPRHAETSPSGTRATIRTVSADATGKPEDKTYGTIQAAVDASNPGDEIRIQPGTYHETVRMTVPGLRVEGRGASRNEVVITGDHVAATSGGTRNTATVFAEGDGETIDNLTIVNSYQQEHPEKTTDIQAVALFASGDRQAFSHLHLVSYQDTLYAGARGCDASTSTCPTARQRYDDVDIDGAVDVVFGNAKAYFDHTHLHGLARSRVTLTAQNRSLPQQDSGFIFHDCQITADPAVRDMSLGRPWGPLATVAYIGCRIDAPVIASRFSEWAGTKRLDTALFAETGNLDLAATNTATGDASDKSRAGTLCAKTAEQLKSDEGFFTTGPLELDRADNCIR